MSMLLGRLRALGAVGRLSSTLSARPQPSSVASNIFRRLSSTLAEAAPPQPSNDAQRIARWTVRLSHDNTFLSYHRNAIIATVAGCALVQYRKGEGRPPLAGAGLLAMGGLYMYVGSALYVWQVYKLRVPLRLGKWAVFWATFNAFWPVGLWSVSLACLVDETPSWLLEGLRRCEQHLPGVLHSTLFLDPPALYPVSRLLQSLVKHEEERLARVKRRASATLTYREWLFKSNVPVTRAGPLTYSDVSEIIKRRISRLLSLQAELDALTRSGRAVPTPVTAPLLDTLILEAEQLEKVLEVDAAAFSTYDHPLLLAGGWLAWCVVPTEYKLLRAEQEAIGTLIRRIKAVKTLGSIAHANAANGANGGKSNKLPGLL